MYELKPNLDVVFKLKKLQTNAHGLRDKEYPLTKGPRTIRGAIIGDSFTMATGVEASESFHSLIENRLNEGQDSIHFELINFAVSGYNLLNYEGVLEDKIMAYDPDFVMIAYCGLNDDMLPFPVHLNGTYKVKKAENVFFKSYMRKLIELKIKRARPKPKGPDKTEEKAAFIDSQFEKFQAICQQRDLPLIMPYLSIHANRKQRLLKVEEAAARHEIPFVSCVSPFEGKKAIAFFFNKYDGHPNAVAHTLFASSLMNSAVFQQLLIKVKLKRNL